MRKAVLAAMAVASVVLVSACGGQSTSAPAQETTAPTTTTAPAPTVSIPTVSREDCEAVIGDFLNSLHELDSRLDVGLNYEQYGQALGDVSVEYNKLNVDEIPAECIDAAADGEAAFNAYVKASNIWNKCFGDIDCSNDSIMPRLQRNWSKATRKIQSAETALDDLG
jgi:hypothetical protein